MYITSYLICLASFMNASYPGAGNFCLIHVSLVPVLSVVGEQVKLQDEYLTHFASCMGYGCSEGLSFDLLRK